MQIEAARVLCGARRTSSGVALSLRIDEVGLALPVHGVEDQHRLAAGEGATGRGQLGRQRARQLGCDHRPVERRVRR